MARDSRVNADRASQKKRKSGLTDGRTEAGYGVATVHAIFLFPEYGRIHSQIVVAGGWAGAV